ncbi:EF-hand calcium-binding domain-containing protein 6-like isoform X4 [Mytilus trossulus]|uniref:EF-hand calcium-binding domain-containing protein 6-like isoform X4 n=1 Tax=Mytilus trossulus TaxID=6551 RepID=UPI003006C941
MASSMAVPRSSRSVGSGRGKNMPLITHPMANLGDMTDLSIRGTSSLGLHRQKTDVSFNRTKQDLGANVRRSTTAVERDEDGIPNGRKSCPDRILQWPPEYLVGPKASAVKCEDLQFSPARDKVLELTDIVRERLTTGYYGLRHLFRANDPTGQGNVSREALLRILYSLCGFITREQYSKFLKSLGLEGKETIAFDNFVACFKENETVQKQWVSPVQRSALEEALKRRHPEDRLKLDLKRHDPYTSAPFSDTIFKSKLKTIEDARKVFPAICFEPDGMIVPPQLREAYAHIGIYLHDSDFQVLWDRYDTEGSGGIRTIPFLRKLGCDLNPRPKTFHRSHTQVPVQQPQRPKSDHFLYKSVDIIDKVQHDVETDTALQVEKTTEQIGNGVIKTTEKSETTVEKESKTESTECQTKVKPAKPKLRKGQPKLDNIIDCLHYRFEESYNAILTAFELFDNLSDGYISRVDFRRVLQEFGFNISISDLDHFLSRASIRSIRGQLNYKEFLYKYQSKSENSMTNRIVTNQAHIFQHDSQPLPNSNLSVEEMEAKLVDYFHGDFLKLMSFLKSCDKYGLGVITPHEFRGALEKRLGYTMSDKQWEQLKNDVGQDADGLIPYNKFLQLFDVIKANKKRPGSWNKKQEGGVDVVKVVKSDMPTPAVVELLMKEKAKTSISFKEVEKPKIDGSGNKTIVELKRLLEELFKNKFHTFDKHFKQMDRKMMGRMSKWQFGALIKLCGLSMNQQELDKVWATLSVANDGMYSYSALIRHFMQFKSKNKTAENVLIEDTTDAVERAHQVQRERREKKAQETHMPIETIEPEPQKTAPSSAMSVKSVRTKDLLVKVKPDVISNWEGLKSVFKYIDKNGCATVNYNEITEVMESMKFNLSAEELKELILRFDLQKNGRFHYLEFMKCFSNRPVPASRYKTLVYSKHAHKLEQKQRDIGSATVAQVINNMRKKMMNEHRNLKRAFKKMDRQNRGYLSVIDFKKVLTTCKVSFSNEDFYHILSEFDHNMTGKISYQDFLTTFMNANI